MATISRPGTILALAILAAMLALGVGGMVALGADARGTPESVVVSVYISSPSLEDSNYTFNCPNGTVLVISTSQGRNWTVTVSATGPVSPLDSGCVVERLQASGLGWAVPVVKMALAGWEGPVGIEFFSDSSTLGYTATQTTGIAPATSTGSGEVPLAVGVQTTTTATGTSWAYAESGEASSPSGGGELSRIGVILGVALITGAVATLVVSRGSW